MKQTHVLALVLPMLALLTACSDPAERNDEATGADIVFHGGSIWTGVGGAPRAEAIAVKDGVIQRIGGDEEILGAVGADVPRRDLEGAFVVPGFIDNHTHFLTGGFGLAGVRLRDAATPEEFGARIARFAQSGPTDRWVLNGDWDHEAWGGELPDRRWIDAATPETPVFVTRLDGHMALANSRAMDLAGVTAETASPAGGEIVRDAGGRPTGVFKDTAMELILEAIPAPTDAAYDQALRAAERHALSRGVTEIHDMAGDGWRSFEAFRRARAAEALRLRVYSFAPLADWERLAEFVKANGRGDARLRWGALKGFVDGSLGSTTAWFYEPYDDAPETSGFAISDLETLEADIAGAGEAGLHTTVHAIGDRANDWLLDVFERVAIDDLAARRYRVEHAQHLTARAIERFAALDVIASMQPYHAIDDGRWAEKRIGSRRIPTAYAFADLLTAGARLTFGSDWTVAPLDPLSGVYAAVTRRTLDGAHPGGWVADQKITVEQALTAYTAANAWAGFAEDRAGTLEVGKVADFVILGEDLFAIDPVQIREVEVLATVIDGEVVFAAE